jgi:glycosyltransferase involved in cell wall biosynthesis
MQRVSGTDSTISRERKMIVLWLAPYPIDKVLPSEKLVDPLKKGKANWLVNLAGVLANSMPVELHILCHSANVFRNEYMIDNNIHFHIFRYKMPFINKGFPTYFRYDILTGYKGFIRPALRFILELNPDIVHVHGTEGAFGLITKYHKKYPTIVSIQGIINEYLKNKIGFFKLLHKEQERETILQNTFFGCRTEWDKSFVTSIKHNASVYYLPEAINEVFYNVCWNNQNKFKIIFVGSILKRKGIEDLLKSIVSIKAEMPEIILDVVGRGNTYYIEKLKKYTIANHISGNVNWLGFKNSNEIAGLLKESSVFVLPSYADNSPNSICEAMAVGVPCIAYSSGGIPSLIKHEYDGLLVETGNICELTNALRLLLTHEDLKNKISVNSRNISLSRNYPKAVAETTYKVYNQVIDVIKK